MYLDEGRRLYYTDRGKSRTLIGMGATGNTHTIQPAGSEHSHSSSMGPDVPSPSWNGGTEDALDIARNKLQELMQLFYLLSRDARVPQNARHHVTIAQSEIALLSKIVLNGAASTGRPGESLDRRGPHQL